MTDVILVSVKLKEQCELRCLRIVALNQNALAVELFTEDIGCEIGSDESNFEVALISCVVVDNVVNGVVGVEVVILAVGVNT